MTRDELLTRLAGLRQARVGQVRVPHKPLLLLWLFGQFAATGSSAASYQQAEEPVSKLINGQDRESRALELTPFIRVIAGKTGQDACYFYNRVDGAQVRWVSYHFHPEPELLLPDEDVVELLATLSGSDATGEGPG